MKNNTTGLEKAQQEADDLLIEMGDRTFECGKQSLKVGNQGLQLWEGGKPVQSIIYQQLKSWEEADNKKSVALVVEGQGGKKDTKIKLKTTEGTDICAAILKHALDVKKARKAERQAKKALAQELEGEWEVVHGTGAQVRKTAKLDSAKVAVVAFGETLTVDKAEPNFEGSFKTRLRMVPKEVKLKDGSEQEVEGWITMKNDKGVEFVRQVGAEAGEDGSAEEEEEE